MGTEEEFFLVLRGNLSNFGFQQGIIHQNTKVPDSVPGPSIQFHSLLALLKAFLLILNCSRLFAYPIQTCVCQHTFEQAETEEIINFQPAT